MNLLIIGSGAREHAFAYKIHESKHDVNIYVSNANPGTSNVALPVNLDINDFNCVKDCIINLNISFVIVGPEIPLINGIYDFITNDKLLSHVKVIGPSKIGSQLEASKDFAKNFMNK